MVIRIEPFQTVPGQAPQFGAEVTGIDINYLSCEEVEALKQAVWEHKILIVKKQKDLLPYKQWELAIRLDPTATPPADVLDFMKDFHPNAGGLLKARGVTYVPNVPNVHVIGKGFQGEDHYGIKNKNITQSFSYENHEPPLAPQEMERGFVRFQGWHCDAPHYKRNPARFTLFRVVKLPKGPDVTIRWDDGSGYEMRSPPGHTLFFSTEELYEECLSDEEKQLADHSWVEYSAWPYEYTLECKVRPNGLGNLSQDVELSDEEMNALSPDPAHVKICPLVWVNPQTGRKAFQVQWNAARRLYLRRSVDEQPTVINEIARVREFIYDIQQRILRPEKVLVPPEEEGDLLIWDNWATMHTRVDYPSHYGPKTCHQCAANAAELPVGPAEMPDLSKVGGRENRRLYSGSTKDVDAFSHLGSAKEARSAPTSSIMAP